MDPLEEYQYHRKKKVTRVSLNHQRRAEWEIAPRPGLYVPVDGKQKKVFKTGYKFLVSLVT